MAKEMVTYEEVDEPIQAGDYFLHTGQDRIFEATEVRLDGTVITPNYPLDTFPPSKYLKKIKILLRRDVN